MKTQLEMTTNPSAYVKAQQQPYDLKIRFLLIVIAGLVKYKTLHKEDIPQIMELIDLCGGNLLTEEQLNAWFHTTE